MTALQDSQRAIIGALLDSRDTLDSDAYRALLATLEAWLKKELHRLTLGEALQARGDQ